MEDKVIKVDEDKVKILVEDLFAAKEDAEVRRRTEETIRASAETINDLTTALEEKQTEFESASTKIEELEVKVADLTTELEAAQEEKASAEEKLIEFTTVVEEMKKDRASEERLAALEEAGVSNDGEAFIARIRDMSDEEFASYKDERIELRKSVISELEANKEEIETAEEVALDPEVTVETEEAGKEQSASDEEVVITPPAEIDAAKAVSASLNFETVLSKDVQSRFAKLGDAMAENWVGKKDK